MPVDEGTLRSNSFNFAPGRFSNYLGGFLGLLAEKLQVNEFFYHVISFPQDFMALFMAAEFSPFFHPRCMVKDISSSPEMARISISISMATTGRGDEKCANWAPTGRFVIDNLWMRMRMMMMNGFLNGSLNGILNGCLNGCLNG